MPHQLWVPWEVPSPTAHHKVCPLRGCLHSSEIHGFCGFLGLGLDFGIISLAISQIPRNIQALQQKENYFQIIKSMINNSCLSSICYNLFQSSQNLHRASEIHKLLALHGKLVLKIMLVPASSRGKVTLSLVYNMNKANTYARCITDSTIESFSYITRKYPHLENVSKRQYNIRKYYHHSIFFTRLFFSKF